ncbi:ARM repeat-containing protein [Athelia psychrophila]|uniref:ARM repeat-containing protein n=1 Tax=Athelia psychrophila TaxID=1759441 RepID=A0A166NSV2_9AGAM|nr:ARM repeat-containing protein [Fibularhizoctonia sp. CBS 109695]
MGKTQKKRAMRRHNPMRVPDSHLPKGLEAAEASSTKAEAILPILQKMESADGAERKWACVAVSNLIQNDPSTRRLLQGKNVVGILITRLSDSEEEVVIEAAGALRNLCIDGGFDICAEMYNKNILTLLKTFVPKLSTTLSQYLDRSDATPHNAQKLIYEFADNIITIMWCLSETSNKALNAINQINLVPFLMSFLAAREQLPIATVTAAAHCLYVLTDDNYLALNEVRSNAAYTSCLFDIARLPSLVPNGKGKETEANERTTTFQVLVSGILRNIAPIRKSDIDIDKDIVIPLLQPVISSAILSDASNTAIELVRKEESEPRMDKLSLNHEPKSDHKSSNEVELERIERKLRSVQLALEVMTGVCATLPDPEPEMAEDAADEEDGDQDIMDEDTEMAIDDAAPATQTSTASLPALVQPLMTLIHPTLLSFPPANGLSPSPPITSALGAIHLGAFECLNNIFLSLSTSSNAAVSSDGDSGRKIWNEVWAALSAIGAQSGPGQERRQEIWQVAIGVLWGIGIIWKGSLIPQEEQLSSLLQLCEATSDPQVKVKCIGTMECLAQHPESIAANATVSNYFFSLLDSMGGSSPADAEPLIQATSALIDIYSDESMPYDVNFRTGKYADRLAAHLDGFKKVVKAIDRRKEGGKDLRRRGDEVRENLADFIEYRKGLGL